MISWRMTYLYCVDGDKVALKTQVLVVKRAPCLSLSVGVVPRTGIEPVRPFRNPGF
jgi:hypothetical protein